jgi:hypothetical protein
MLVEFVPMSEHAVLVVFIRNLFGLSLLQTPVHVQQLILVLFAVGFRRKPSLLAVEWSLLNVDLLQVLNVLLYPQGPLTHVVSIHVIEWNLFLPIRVQ